MQSLESHCSHALWQAPLFPCVCAPCVPIVLTADGKGRVRELVFPPSHLVTSIPLWLLMRRTARVNEGKLK